MKMILFIPLALIVLLLMVTIHEFGHYIAGKLLGFKINEFSIGFGKALYQRKSKKSDEVFSIRLIPLGGFCAFEGEEEDSESPDSFEKQAPWKRMIVLFAGPFFNLLSAVLFSIILLCSIGYDIPEVVKIANVTEIVDMAELQDSDIIKIISGTELNETDRFSASELSDYISENMDTLGSDIGVETNYPLTVIRDNADIMLTIKAVTYSNRDKLQPGDVIFKVDGDSIGFLTESRISSLVAKNSDDGIVDLVVKRNGEKIIIKNVNVYEYHLDEGVTKGIGVVITSYVHSFWEALVRCIPFTLEMAWEILIIFGKIITGSIGLSSVGGPITTIATIANYSSQSLAILLVLMPLIAANLAVFNFLPIPALDGSKFVFTLIEQIRGKPINRNVENMIHNIGLLILFGLVIIADLYQVFFAHLFF